MRGLGMVGRIGLVALAISCGPGMNAEEAQAQCERAFQAGVFPEESREECESCYQECATCRWTEDEPPVFFCGETWED